MGPISVNDDEELIYNVGYLYRVGAEKNGKEQKFEIRDILYIIKKLFVMTMPVRGKIELGAIELSFSPNSSVNHRLITKSCCHINFILMITC